MDELLQAWIHGTSLPPLPGAEKAKVWEPKPATVYAWGSA